MDRQAIQQAYRDFLNEHPLHEVETIEDHILRFMAWCARFEYFDLILFQKDA